MPFRRVHEANDLCAIYVHAGAGFHSVANEKNHLSAVNDAARVGMAILKNGGDATDAVEMAIRLLEDREITNAGYGSNLTIDGQVECDACMVDHLGRSGAVGAISRVKNPIAVARLVLHASTQPLSLQRVPPNFLVGPGAADFAADHGIPLLPPDYLVSEAARARWISWRDDLVAADVKERGHIVNTNDKTTYEPIPVLAPGTSTISPPASPDNPVSHNQDPRIGRHNILPEDYMKYARVDEEYIEDDESGTDDHLAVLASASKRQRLNGSTDNPHDNEDTEMHLQQQGDSPAIDRADRITDTVGAIAIDCFGRIAAGSSSGGIGMKHRGRCGPAALVGIGTAVIPVDPEDPEKASVATVTSGTGEHMATTAAAQTASDRVYSSVRKRHGQLESCNEDEAMHSVIKKDFMNHPGVRNSPCVGAIGIVTVKKTNHGIYFYFAHNTDSFALASMHSDERKPVCVMSRSKGSGSIAQGARKARQRRTGEE